MEAFVGSLSAPSLLRGSRSATSGRTSSKSTICMSKQDARNTELWKQKWAGGFPGGEGFFARWVENGMKDYVPGLEDEKQVSGAQKPSSAKPTASKSDKEQPKKKAGEAESKASQQKPYAPSDDDPDVVMETDSSGRMRLVYKNKDKKK